MASSPEKAKPDGELVQRTKIPYWRLVADQAGVTTDVLNFPYPGAGTEEDPYLVQFIPDDPRNPMLFSTFKKWFITMDVAIATLAVALVSSAYTGGLVEIMTEFKISQEVATLGVSLFVLGFAIGPLLWAPLSELFGRQVLFIGTYAALTAFNAGCAGAQNGHTLIILRFMAGAFGSSPLTNAGGVIADMFPASQRGLAMALFAAAPFLGPVLGPVIGGFLGMTEGWRWVMGFLAIFSGALWIIGSLTVPETYAPVILRKRAAQLSKATGKHYLSTIDHQRGKVTLGAAMKTALLRPWILLFKEPIVLLLSIYMAIIYGTLYMLFAAFPIVYQQNRGWNQGVGGLSFLGIMIGMLFAIAYTIPANKRYIKIEEEHGGFAPPEARLYSAMVGSVALPIGLFWFAWTNSPTIHWAVSIAAGIPFGFGMVLVFLSIMNYLIDSYTIFAASVLAANSVLRSLFGAAFPLFTAQMYDRLGIHWASTIPAFLALACVPFPFLFFKYGPAIRERCKFAAQSAAFMKNLQQSEDSSTDEPEKAEEAVLAAEDDSSDEDEVSTVVDEPTFAAIRSRASTTASARRKSYDANPYDIDRVNTRESFANI
ncbi:major facilitator superfamily domain-containing protein [Ilyonectria destructans]|nr:major facilitator superfamily domain-containing protein [Ilyonectria destructans]